MAPRKRTKAPNAVAGATTTSLGGVAGGLHPLVAQNQTPQAQANRNRRPVIGPPGPPVNDYTRVNDHSIYNELARDYVREAIETLDTSGNWFSPFQPIQPFGPPNVMYPRTFDYRTGLNLDIQPQRTNVFAMLRTMSRSWGLLRTVIETRKDQFMRMPHAFQVKGAPRKKSKYIDELNAFFVRPDGKNTFSRWKRLLLEDMLVIDAATIFKWKSVTGHPLAYDVIDGATIKPLIDDAGRRPTAPDPAYQQIIKGLPMTNWTEDDIRYAPMRPVPDIPIYGYSPVEQILAEITAGIKRLSYQVSFWTEGSMPELIITAPEAWTPTQLAQYQGMFDAMMSGNTPYKSKVRFVPGGMKPFDIKNANGEALKAEIDEWWARLICYAFSVSPQPFIKMMNRSTAQSAQQQAEEEGLHPVMLWFKEEIMDPIVQEDFGYDDIEFNFLPNPEVDQAKQADILKTYVSTGIMEINEAREQLGLDKMPGGDQLIFETGTGPVPLKETLDAARLRANDVPNEIQRTQEKHTNDMKVDRLKAKQKPVAAVKKAGGVGEDADTPFVEEGSMEDAVTGIFNDHRDEIAATVIAALGAYDLSDHSELSIGEIDDVATGVANVADLSGLEELASELPPYLDPAYVGGGEGMSATLAVSPFEQVHHFALAYAKERAAEMVGMTWEDGMLVPNPDAEMVITDATRNMIKQLVVKALSPPDGQPFDLKYALQDLRDEVKGGYIFSRKRAALIAQVELGMAHNEGSLAQLRAMARAGLDVSKYWSTAKDDKVCAEICAQNAMAGWIPVNHIFPSGHFAPLGHPKCRCKLVGRINPKENEQ